MASLLRVQDLSIHFGDTPVVNGVSFDLQAGRTMALVGSSGSGKSATALAVLRLLDDSARVSGKILFHDLDLLSCGKKQLQEVRGRRIAMIFQEPMTSLNPVFTIGFQLRESLRRHEALSRAAVDARVRDLLAEVGLSGDKISAYPHELSGGQRQRVMIAMALACRPELLIADEPTTALDVLVQKQILDLLGDLQKKYGMALLLITHDQRLVASRADEVKILQGGRLVATPPAFPATLQKKSPPPHFETLLEVKGLNKSFPIHSAILRRPIGWRPILENVNLKLGRGRVLGVTGPSGSGKTTLAKALLRLTEVNSGQILFEGQDVSALGGGELRRLRKKMQIVFQDPYSSLNPKLSVESLLTEPMAVHHIGGSHAERKERAADLMKQVGLEPAWLRRYPHEFSGGQRQRVAIARALAVEPSFIICDEAVSSLDAPLRGQILQLLQDLKERHQLSYIFISHDIEMLRGFADDIAVLEQGRVVINTDF